MTEKWLSFGNNRVVLSRNLVKALLCMMLFFVFFLFLL